MDNIKTGNLIREARKEKELTQRQLAETLHVTDRAVSKWERGVCAPDIALLEPLGEILGLSLTELIQGERSAVTDAETAVREAISYSKAEMRRDGGKRRKMVAIAALSLVIAVALCLGMLWYKGVFYIEGRYTSPDDSIVTTVYSRDLGLSGPPEKGGFTLKDKGYFQGMVSYLSAEFKGLWWSPDSRKQVVAMSPVGEEWDGFGNTILVLHDYKRSTGSNLDSHLEMGIYDKELFKAVPWDEEHYRRPIEFEFVQWSGADPDKMLIYFWYFDADDAYHEGYLWYDWESGEVSGEMEIEQDEKNTDALLKVWDEIMG